MRKTGPTNIWLRLLCSKLTKYSANYECGVWRRVAEELSKPSRRRVVVNLSRIERNAKSGSTLIVPGSVLGSGNITKPVSVAAYRFSSMAKKKLLEAGGQALMIEELLEKNPSGKGVIMVK